MTGPRAKVGVVGGRGVVGAELMKLLAAHPHVDVVFGEGTRVSPDEAAAAPVDALILSAPNGVAAAYVNALNLRAPGTAVTVRDSTVVIDVSSDFRFDDAWVYGLPERNRESIRGATRIANPGCYATGAQIGLDPFLRYAEASSSHAGAPAIFGVSGYSGAGTTPSPRNDPARLADNLLPYALVDHTHEKEIARHLKAPVAFMPHVAPFFVGITLTITMPLKDGHGLDGQRAFDVAAERWQGEPLVKVVRDIPEVRDCRGTHVVTVGGFAVDEKKTRLCFVATIDNLLKGAASQAVQNLNLALGFDELAGLQGTATTGAAAKREDA